MSIAAGEQLTERQALQALLLPSANNIAAVLARWAAGSADRFVARMNATARSLGMTHTRYTDRAATTTQPCRLPPTRCASSIGRCAYRCSRVSSPRRARRCRSPAPCTTPTRCSGTTGLSASRPARTTRPAAASPSGPSAGSTASGRRSPGSCWGSPATTGSRRVSRPPRPWSTGSPVSGLCQIERNEPCHHELRPEPCHHELRSEASDHGSRRCPQVPRTIQGCSRDRRARHGGGVDASTTR